MAGDLTLDSVNNSSTDRAADRAADNSTAVLPTLQDEGQSEARQGAESEPTSSEDISRLEGKAEIQPVADAELMPELMPEPIPEPIPDQSAKTTEVVEVRHEPNQRKLHLNEQLKLERYLDQITRVFENHQQLLTISRNDNALLADELTQLKAQYDDRIATIEKQNREHIEVITAQLDGLKGENNRLNHDLASKDIENALLAKNFQLQEDNLSHVKKELAEASAEGAKQQIDQLTAAKAELTDMVSRLEAELKELHSERAALQKDLDDEADQKNALISRFRAEIATLEEKHALQLERQALELERKLLDRGQSTSEP